MSSVGDVHGPADPEASSKARHSPLDYRNGDLVSRLLAATPPYLYNPLAPHSFFFSEMLRSFVQAKNEQPMPAARSAPRRNRKRSWRESTAYERVKPALGPPAMDKPLELTTSRVHAEETKPASTSPVLPPAPPLLMPPCGFPPLPAPPDSSMHSDMLLPPPPPMWYPSLYPLSPQPPYGIDPLHFFIDLRVSGHIWDRKMGKDSPADLSVPEGSPTRAEEKLPSRTVTPEPTPAASSSFSLVKQSKHCSAFSVPHPRSLAEKREATHAPKGTTGTHYIFQNLPRIYQDVRGSQETPGSSEEKEDGAAAAEGEGEKPKVKDLRALIGLELVVDYVQQDGEPGQKPGTEDTEKPSAHPEAAEREVSP